MSDETTEQKGRTKVLRGEEREGKRKRLEAAQCVGSQGMSPLRSTCFVKLSLFRMVTREFGRLFHVLTVRTKKLCSLFLV